MDKPAPDPLKAIRDRIDAIDETVHRLLIDRSGVIAELIEIKGTSKPGAAFRPDREADMMRRLVMRHKGKLPLATVEHIWREIITTFTAMQAPFGVVTGPSNDVLAMRDLVRFYFGFSVRVTNARSSEEAIAKVVASGNDIAVLDGYASDRWWGALTDADAPRIFAKLPFIEVPSHPLYLSFAYVIGPRLSEGIAPDIQVLSMSNASGLEAAIHSFGGDVVAYSDRDMVVELPITASISDLSKAIDEPIQNARSLGAFFQPIHYVAERVA
jgi:chorismate mutase-like protein